MSEKENAKQMISKIEALSRYDSDFELFKED
jgi:hypothetical protein